MASDMSLDGISIDIEKDVLLEAIEVMPAALALFDNNLVMIACNGHYATYHQCRQDWLVGQTLNEVAAYTATIVKSIDGQVIERPEHVYEMSLERIRALDGDSWETELKDGQWFLTSFHSTKQGGLVSTWVDITRQKVIENEARLNQVRLEDAINSVQDIFALYDEDRRLVICNPAYARYQHKSVAELIGTYHPDNVVNSHQYISKINGAPLDISPADYVSVATPHLSKTSTGRQIETNDGKIYLANDWITENGGVVFVARDITTQNIAQRRFEDAVEVMPAAFGLFDGEGVLVACNNAYTEYHRCPRDKLLGMRVEEIVEQATNFVVSVGGQPVSDADETNKHVVARIKELSGDSWEVEMEGGRWYQTGYQATQEGGFVSVSLDVTDYKTLQKEHQLNQTRMDDALEAMSDVFALYDSDLSLVACNSAYANFTGLDKPAAMGMNFEDLVALSSQNVEKFNDIAVDQLPNRYIDMVEEFSQEKSVAVELQMRSGKVLLANDWRTQSGGQIFLARDISSLKSIQRRFEDAIEAMPQMFCLWDADLRLITCNSAFATYFGRSKSELAGRNAIGLSKYIFRFIDHGVSSQTGASPDDPSAMLDWIRHPNNQAGEFVGTNGEHFVFSVSPSADGGAVFTGRNVTELRQAEQEVRLQQEALVQSEKMNALGTMLAGVAHELNNPLSVVVGQTLLMKETAEDENVQRRAELIGNAADRCARIVKSFLAMARQNPTESLSVDLNEIISDTVEVLKYSLGQSSIFVECDLAERLPSVWGDPDHLGQIVLNLVVNAQHALEEVDGERVVSVRTEARDGTGEVLVHVQDNGPGVPHDLRNRIFEPFFTTKEAGTGTGLGLALARKTIETHNGSLTVDDAPDGGSVFTIKLPADTSPTEEALLEEPIEASSRSHILIIDDEEDVITTMREILESDGHDVTTANSGTEALNHIARNNFDAILTDLRMQEMDGPAFYRQIKDKHPDLLDHVGFVTGDSLSKDIKAFLIEADRPTVEKPFSPDDIRNLIGGLVTR